MVDEATAAKMKFMVAIGYMSLARNAIDELEQDGTIGTDEAHELTDMTTDLQKRLNGLNGE